MKAALALLAVAACSPGSMAPGHTFPTDGSFEGTDDDACNPLTQTGCRTDEKCAWIVDQVGSDSYDLAHIGCPAQGSAQRGSACSGGVGIVGADNCVGGTACVDSTCAKLCDPASTTACGSASSCITLPNFYDAGSDAVAGVCLVSCDPLTQKLGRFGTTMHDAPACPIGNACYGDPTRDGGFYCATDGNSSAIDGTPESANAYGANACAPGNVAIFTVDDTGTAVTLCSAFCEPGETWNAAPDLAAVQSGVAPHACPNARENCVYTWSIGGPGEAYVPGVDPLSALRPWSDHLGVCFDWSQVEYNPIDPRHGEEPSVPYPNCAAVALDATLDPSTCTLGSPCTSPTQAAELFGAVDLGCVSYETAIANPDPTFARDLVRRVRARVRFARAN